MRSARYLPGPTRCRCLTTPYAIQLTTGTRMMNTIHAIFAPREIHWPATSLVKKSITEIDAGRHEALWFA